MEQKITNGVAKAGYSTTLDVKVDIDFSNANSVVSVRVWTYGVGTTSMVVVALGQKVACDCIGILGWVDGGSYADVEGLEPSIFLRLGGCAMGTRNRAPRVAIRAYGIYVQGKRGSRVERRCHGSTSVGVGVAFKRAGAGAGDGC